MVTVFFDIEKRVQAYTHPLRMFLVALFSFVFISRDLLTGLPCSNSAC